MRWSIGIAIVLVAVVGFFFWKNLSMPKTTGLINGRLQLCPKSPNCVCCCHDDTVHYIAPLPYSSEETLDQIQAYLSQHYIIQVVQRNPDYLHVVVTTPTLRFKDDLEFAVNRQKGIVLVRSASRVGYSDGGINRSRIEAVRTFLENH
ncbi:MAG: DUF1499 domain-containing protein [Rhabdochlamydiaceae bacterium]